ncbi:hypothetical protein E3U43_008379 [Larimichthys crocea]|uniref:Uncharacterized protein n=1 Tax=Larimichthys crocea TaxID=215358 RepID=A0ACD3RV87_LARCR|nr:hypothetical protein E3U43_008379 [Larimichthys crocea]
MCLSCHCLHPSVLTQHPLQHISIHLTLMHPHTTVHMTMQPPTSSTLTLTLTLHHRVPSLDRGESGLCQIIVYPRSPVSSTSCGSNVSSPLFFDGTLSERSGPSPRELVEEKHGYDSHICPLEVNESQYVNRQDSPEGLRSLPHKLRFKGPSGCNEGGELSPSSDIRHSGPPVATVGPNIQMRNHQQVGWESRTEGQTPWSREEACGGVGQQYQRPSCGYYNSTSLQYSRDTKYLTEDISLRSKISCLSQEVAQLKRLFSQQLLNKMA